MEERKNRGRPSEASLHQPHDKLFKGTFGNIPEAVGLLRNHLPKWLSTQLDFAQTQRVPHSFIDERLKHKESDLLFSIPLLSGTRILIYVLIEHQSSEDPKISLRLLTYMTRAWETFINENPGKPLPIIFPLVIAQGNKPWKTSPEFKHLFDLPKDLPPELLRHIPLFEFYLMQLVNIPYPKLKGTPNGILVLTALKAQPLKELMSDWLWEQGFQNISPHIFTMVLHYIIDQGDIDINTFFDKIEAIHQPPAKEHAMTIAEQLRQQGRQEGYELAQREHLTIAEQLRQQGYERAQREHRAIAEQSRQEGSLKTLRQLLTHKYGTLPQWAEQKLADADYLQIESWTHRIFNEIPLEQMLA